MIELTRESRAEDEGEEEDAGDEANEEEEEEPSFLVIKDRHSFKLKCKCKGMTQGKVTQRVKRKR